MPQVTTRVGGSSKRQQPYRPQVSVITRHQRSDVLGRPSLTFVPLDHTEELSSSGHI